LAGLAHQGKAFEQQIIERLTRPRAFTQSIGGLSQLRVGVMLELFLVAIDPADALFICLELLRLAHAKRAVQDGHGASVAVVSRGSDSLYRRLKSRPERHSQRPQMVSEAHAKRSRRAVVAADQRRFARAA